MEVIVFNHSFQTARAQHGYQPLRASAEPSF